MIDGLVFIWVEKEIISEVIKHFETQDMQYVENVCWVMLDETKRKCKFISSLSDSHLIEVDDSMSIDVSPAYICDESKFVRKSKKTLLIFRRL